MSEEQQQSLNIDSNSFSRAETIELLQGTAQRFEELITQLQTESNDYLLPKRSYKTLLATLENIFNGIAAASESVEPNDFEKIDLDLDYSGREKTLELLQQTVDLFAKTIDIITKESIDYQLPMSDFENLAATTEKIVNPFGQAPVTPLETSAEPQIDSFDSNTELPVDVPSSGGINWPWLGLVAIILVIVVSVSFLVGNQNSLQEEIAIEVPQGTLEFTPEQKAIASIDKQIETVLVNYNKAGIAKIEPNFVADTLTIQLAEDWQELDRETKEKMTNEWLEESRKFEFKKLAIIDREGTLVARSPIIGKNIVILKP